MHVIIEVPSSVNNLAMDAYSLDYLVYFFEDHAVAILGYLNGVNPFDQPRGRSLQEEYVCPLRQARF